MSRPASPAKDFPLSEERFNALLEAYGARLSAWPAAERRAAEALILDSEVARAALRREAELDVVLFAGPGEPPELSADLARRLNELPVRHPRTLAQNPLQAWLRRWVWAPALGFSLLTAAAVVLGSQADETSAGLDEDSSILIESDALELALGLTPEFEEGAP